MKRNNDLEIFNPVSTLATSQQHHQPTHPADVEQGVGRTGLGRELFLIQQLSKLTSVRDKPMI
jgi:hypothetical protein